MLQEIERGLHRAGVESGATLVLACSGGPDSTAMATAMHELGREGVGLTVAHYNHRTRGEESDGDEEFMRDVCNMLDLPLTVGSAPVAFDHLSEADARRMRYEFLEQVALKFGLRYVAVAHTADDQAETVLLRIARGTGVRGLASMEPARDMSVDSGVQLIRPMLTLHRLDVDEYLRGKDIVARQDSSNDDLRYARNRVRHTLMPALKELNPEVVDAITRLAADAREHRDVIALQAAEHMPSSDSIETRLLARLPQPVAAYILEHMHSLVATGEGDAQLERHHIEEALRLVSRREPSEMHLPGNVLLRNRYGETSLAHSERHGAMAAPIVGELDLELPGRVMLPDGSSITADVAVPPESFAAGVASDNSYAWLTHELTTEDGLLVRGRRPGDRYAPLGCEYAVKVQDLFVDAKVEEERRDSMPIVVNSSDGRIAWIAGFPPAEWAKVKEGDSSCVKLAWRDSG